MKPTKRIIDRNNFLLSREKGTVYKDHGGKVRVCLVYPNTYHVGMSNLGFRFIYSFSNKRYDVVCERAFLPEKDLIERYRISKTAIFSMESMKVLNSFDIIAFSVSFENDYPNIIKILDMAKVPLYAKDRDRSHPLIIMGGPCAFMNPEPVADFFDIIFTGEAEGLFDRFIDLFKECKDKAELFKYLKGFKGIYLPAFYKIKYKKDGVIKERIPLNGYPENIKRQSFPDFNSYSFAPQIISYDTEFSNMYLIEAMRGCPWSCRFCAVSNIYGKPRKKDLDTLSHNIGKAKSVTKKIGIIGPSLTDYAHIKDILRINGVDFSITSLRASPQSSEVLSLIKNKKSISIAPEVGSDRLRHRINKRIKREDIIKTVRLIFESGIETLRLYFMIGLPTETDENIHDIVELAREVRGIYKGGNIVLSINIFVPKPFTAFQWHPMVDTALAKRRLSILREGLKRDNLKIITEGTKYAYMQGAFSMGDRRLSRVIELMLFEKNLDNAFRSAGLNQDFYIYRRKAYNEILPWDFITNGIDKKILWKEYNEVFSN